MNREIKGAKESVTISASIGATFYNPNKNFNILYKEADEALYKSKENGKNQITIYA
jgi:PleD family two-component response regulator